MQDGVYMKFMRLICSDVTSKAGWIYGRISPGTILKTLRVPPPDRPSIEMQRDPHFQQVVTGIRDIIDKLESSSRAGD